MEKAMKKSMIIRYYLSEEFLRRRRLHHSEPLANPQEIAQPEAPRGSGERREPVDLIDTRPIKKRRVDTDAADAANAVAVA